MAGKNNLPEDGFGREFIITREFAAPRELVFQACTDPKHLAQWWGPKGFSNPVCEWDARPGGKIYVVMRAPNGADFPMGGECREVVPPERLVTVTGALDARGKMLFEILHTLTLVEHNGKTQLTMHSRVIKTTAGAGRYIGGFETGMTLSLERLAGHLAAKTEPFVIERTFHAPATTVWKALTDKGDLARWFFDLKEFKAEAGCEFEFTVEHEGMKYCHRCKVTDVIPQKRLAYTWRYEGHAGDSLVAVELLAEGDKTRLRLTHTGLETFPPLPPFARTNFLRGWTSLIGESLKQFVESNSTNQPTSKMTKPNNNLTVQPYLFFGGRCEEALEFYRTALGAEVMLLLRFKDSPEPPQPGMCPPGSENKVMHASFRVGDATLMASDGRCESRQNFQGFSLSLTLSEVADADRLFAALADGGEVHMPLTKTFYSPRFGMVADRFGVLWMIYVTP